MTNEELILKFYDGDETILEKLYHKNIGFIRSIAKAVAVNFNCSHKNLVSPHSFRLYKVRLLFVRSHLQGRLYILFLFCAY